MTRSRLFLVLAGCVALHAFAPSRASASDSTAPSVDDVSVGVAAPFKLAIRDRSWNGDAHAAPTGRAVLERADGSLIWDLADVTGAVTSADGKTVALETSDNEVHVSRLPDSPRRIDGGPYLSPALSNDGTYLVAQRLGEGGHILEKVYNAKGIAHVNLDTGRDQLLLEGNDLYSPSFALDQRVFFGSGGEEGVASLYILDLPSMRLARVTNRGQGARLPFPSETPRLMGGAVVYVADTVPFRVPEPKPDDYVPAHRFEAPRFVPVEDVSPNFGFVQIRRPNTQLNQTPAVYQYFDVERRVGFTEDWYCSKMTYDQHQGTDFNQDMGWNVVAPAAGRVILRNDGCPNLKSPGCGTGWGNFAAIQHADGSVSLEAHGKNGTVAEKGARLACGDKLMETAKSGNSGVYHVHHETWVNESGNKNKDKRYDPYAGSCDKADPSKWTVQNPYRALPGASCSN